MDRQLRVQLALAITACAPAAWGCSFFIYEPPRACQIRHSATTIFKGRVIDTNAIRGAGINSWALYRFRVDEIFKGLPPETKEVFIDPGSGTSCMSSFQVGRDYLVYTGKVVATSGELFNRVRTSTPSPQMEIPPILQAWERINNSPVFSDLGWSPTRLIENEATDPDLAYLRSMSKVDAGDPPRPGTIFGTVAQNLVGSTPFSDATPFKNVLVTLRPVSADAATAGPLEYRATSGPDGRFEIHGLAPGDYRAEWKPPFHGVQPTRQHSTEVSLPPNGCATIRGAYQTASKISGRVVLPDGVTPARDVIVEAGRLTGNGDPRLRLVAGARTTTDENGGFIIPNIPAGLPVVVGVNLNRAPNRTHRFDPVFAPGSTDNLENARRFQPDPGSSIDGVSIRLPDSLPFGDLYVELFWPDGTPASGGVARAYANLSNGPSAGQAEAKDNSHKVRMELALNREYSIRASWMLFEERFIWIAEESPTKVHFTRHGQNIRVTLKEKWPSPGR